MRPGPLTDRAHGSNRNSSGWAAAEIGIADQQRDDRADYDAQRTDQRGHTDDEPAPVANSERPIAEAFAKFEYGLDLILDGIARVRETA
jgi:hypothetical protein